MRRARAVKDPVLGPFIREASADLAHKLKFTFNPIIHRLDFGWHRSFISENMKVVRKILEETYGPLTAITEGEVVAGRGKGKRTIGFVRAVEKYADLVDENLTRKRGIARGVGHAHNHLTEVIDTNEGNGARPTMTVTVNDDQDAIVAEREHVKRVRTELRERIVDEALNPKVKLEGLGEETKALARKALLEMFK